jgi:hypothetical protein
MKANEYLLPKGYTSGRLFEIPLTNHYWGNCYIAWLQMPSLSPVNEKTNKLKYFVLSSKKKNKSNQRVKSTRFVFPRLGLFFLLCNLKHSKFKSMYGNEWSYIKLKQSLKVICNQIRKVRAVWFGKENLLQ